MPALAKVKGCWVKSGQSTTSALTSLKFNVNEEFSTETIGAFS